MREEKHTIRFWLSGQECLHTPRSSLCEFPVLFIPMPSLTKTFKMTRCKDHLAKRLFFQTTNIDGELARNITYAMGQ
jgi:hypothetical protein